MPRGVKRTVPLYAVCTRRVCGKVFEVRRPFLQKKRKYCSRRCAAFMSKNLNPEAAQRALDASRRARRLAMIVRLHGMTPLEAFRLGYVRGLQAKLRKVRQRFRLVPVRTDQVSGGSVSTS